MDRALGICVIGCGRAGMIHAHSFKGSVSGARLAAICDPAPDRLREAAEELGYPACYERYEDALADPAVDAVVVVTPTDAHRDVVLAAAAAGKHVLCEKPMAASPAQCDEMIAACEAAGVKLQIGFMRRFDPGFRRMKELLDAGEAGEPTLVKSLTHGPSEPQSWMYDISRSGGPLAEVNSHDFDTLRWLAGSEAAWVHAVGHNFRSPEMADEYPDYYDTAACLLEFENGVLGMVEGSQYVRYGYDARVEVLGTTGHLSVGTQQANSVVLARGDGQLVEDSMPTWRTLFSAAYIAEDAAFVRCVHDSTPPEVTGHDGKMALMLVESAIRSLREGRPVRVGE